MPSLRLGLCLAAVLLSAAEPGEVRIRYGLYVPPSTISVQSNLVELAVTVRDSASRPVGGFTAADFTVLDAGMPQLIAFFSEEKQPQERRPQQAVASDPSSAAAPSSAAVRPARPRSLALFFDDTHIAAYGLEKLRSASEKLIDSGLQPGDRLGIFTTSGTVIEDFTSDREVLLAALKRVRPHPPPSASGMQVCPTLTPYQAYVIAMHLDTMAKQIAVAEAIACRCPDPDPACVAQVPDAVQTLAESVWRMFRGQSTTAIDVLTIVVRHLARAPGERLLILTSPGFVTGGMEQSMSALIDTALRSHIVINSLGSEGVLGGGESPEALNGQNGRRYEWAERTTALRQLLLTAILSDASAATGGQFLKGSNDFAAILHALATPPAVSYRIAFAPPGEPDDKYHALKVRLNKPGRYQIDARAGYYSTKPDTKTKETAQDRIDREVVSAATHDPFPAEVRTMVRDTKDGQLAIEVIVTIGAKELTFAEKEGRHVQQLTFVTVLQDREGNYVAGKQAIMDLALTAETLASLQAQGLRASLSFSVPRGTYQIREAVREAVQDHIASSTSVVR
jgi:VWFA-related protein